MVPNITLPRVLVVLGVIFFFAMPAWGTLGFFAICCVLYVIEQKDLVAIAYENYSNRYQEMLREHRELAATHALISAEQEKFAAALIAQAEAMKEVQKVADEAKQMLTQTKISSALKRQ